ncbi:hypothetical protein GCM10017778_43690 [Streptomyces vinaceus]|nr:hypothetical protein GCM10017778_43690 [Streptomyces vinaceus]
MTESVRVVVMIARRVRGMRVLGGMAFSVQGRAAGRRPDGRGAVGRRGRAGDGTDITGVMFW